MTKGLAYGFLCGIVPCIALGWRLVVAASAYQNQLNRMRMEDLEQRRLQVQPNAYEELVGDAERYLTEVGPNG